MAAIITEKFRQHNAGQFLESFSLRLVANKYYLFIGKSSPFTSSTTGGDDNTPPTPNDDVSSEFYKWDSMLGAKLISSVMFHLLFQEGHGQTTQHTICMNMILVHLIQQHQAQPIYMKALSSSPQLKIKFIKCLTIMVELRIVVQNLQRLQQRHLNLVDILFSICTHLLLHKFKSFLRQTLRP